VGWRCISSWEGTQTGQQIQTGQRDIPYRMTSPSAYKNLGKEKGREGSLE